MSSELRQRVKQEIPEPDAGAGFSVKEGIDHPSGQPKHGGPRQLLLATAFSIFMIGGCLWYAEFNTQRSA